jgi:hypothetical protein
MRNFSRRHWLIISVAIVVILAWQIPSRWQASLIFLRNGLRPCDWNEDLFPPIDSGDASAESTVQRWQQTYHQNLSAIVDAHSDQSQARIECIDRPRTEASGPLAQIADGIEPWSSSGEYYEEDMAEIASGYLETYECALRTYRANLYEDLIRQASVVAATSTLFAWPPRNDENMVLMPPVLNQWYKEVPQIDQELKLARPTLERTLTYLNGTDRLRALDVALLCLERASLDIRNVMSLAAETSACVPSRIWDSRGGLFKYQ